MASQITFDILARDRASATFDKVGRSSSKLGGAVGKMGTAVAVGAGVAAVGGIVMLSKAMIQGVKDASSYQDLQNRTANVLKTTGNAAGTSVDKILRRAAALESLSGVDEELIINEQNVLATFTKVRNGTGDYGTRIFDRATEAALNMSVALGTDLQGSTVMLGKALNDPIKGITALSRAGVSFTAQQKAQIKALVKSGDTMKAQQLILGELDKEFGHAAETAGKGFNGSIARVKDIIGDTFRDIGMKLLPTLTRLANGFAKWLPGAIDKTLALGQRLSTWWKSDLAPAFDKARQTILPGLRQAMDMVSGGVGKSSVTWKQVGDVITQKIIPAFAVFMKYYLPYIAFQIRIVIEAIKLLWKAGGILATILVASFKVIFTVFSTVVGGIINGAARAFGWVPGLGPKLQAAAANFNTFRDTINRALAGTASKKSIYVSAPGSSAVIQNLARIRWETAHIPRSVTIGVANKLAGMRAAGGPVSAGKSYLVGEQGPEIITPSRSGYVHPNGSSVGGDFSVTVPLVLQVDGNTLHQSLLRVKRRKGNVSLGLA